MTACIRSASDFIPSRVCLKSRSRGRGPTRLKECCGPSLSRRIGGSRAGQFDDLALKFHRLGDFLGGGLFRFVLQIEHLSLQERPLLIDLHHLEALAAFGHDVHAPVGIFFGNGDNLCCAADLSDSFLFGPDDAKRLLPVQAFGDHLSVAWLENVQWQGCAGEQHQSSGNSGRRLTQRLQEFLDCTPRLWNAEFGSGQVF